MATFTQAISGETIQTTCLVALIWVGLRLLSFQTLRQLLSCISVSVTDVPAVNVITVCRTYLPQTLFLHRRYSVDLRVGIVKKDGGKFETYAWVECRGPVVIGGMEGVACYTAFPSLEGKRL